MPNTPIDREMLTRMLWQGTAWKGSQEALDRFLDLAQEWGRQQFAGNGNIPQVVDAPQVGENGVCPTCGHGPLTMDHVRSWLHQELEARQQQVSVESVLALFDLNVADCVQCVQLQRELATATEHATTLNAQILSLESEHKSDRVALLHTLTQERERISALEGQIALLEQEKRDAHAAYVADVSELTGNVRAIEEERAAMVTEFQVTERQYNAELVALRQELDDARSDLADAMAANIFHPAVAQHEPSVPAVEPVDLSDDPLLTQTVIDAVAGLPADVMVMQPYGRLADGAQIRLFHFDEATGRVHLVTPPAVEQEVVPLPAAAIVEAITADHPTVQLPSETSPAVQQAAVTIASSIAAWPRDDQPPQDFVPDDMQGTCTPVELDEPAKKEAKAPRISPNSTAYEGDEEEPKQCKRCGEWKTRGQFYKDRSLKDGRTSKCRPCSSAAAEREDREAAEHDASA